MADFATEDFTAFCLETITGFVMATFLVIAFCFLTVTWADFGPLEGLTFFLRQLSLLPVLLLSLLPVLLL
jgi:hypothetical protein